MKKKITVEISDAWLNDLECLLICMPLCDKHKKISFDIDTNKKVKGKREFEESYLKCKDCKKVKRTWEKGSWKLSSALWNEFTKKSTQSEHI